MAGRWRAAVRAEPGLVVLVAGFFAAYAAYAVIRHEDFITGLDLAIFDNALWHYSRFETPVSPIKGLPNVLGDHFHPIVVVLAPLYWIWSSPVTLLIAQSALLAVSAVPVFLFARDRLERRPPAYGITVAYLLFWGLQSGAGFEFHELAFAPGLIACAILFADREQWTRCFVSIALLLLVKENLALLVVAFGVYLASRGELRRGFIAAAAGIAWFFLTTKVFIPHFAGQSFAYWTYQDFGDDLPSALGQIVTHPWQPFQVAFDAPQKRETIAYLLLPFLLLPLGSRIAILAIPLLAERFLSVNPQLWATDLHYSLPIAPVLAMGAAAGLANASAWLARRSAVPRDRLRAAGAGAVVLAGVIATVLVAPANLPVFGLAHVHSGAVPDEDALRATLDRLPPGARVATEPRILPHVTHRRDARPLTPQAGMPAYLLVDLVGPSLNATGVAEPFNRQRVGLEITRRLSAYAPVHYDRGWVLLRRGGSGNGVLAPLRGVEAGRLARAAGAWGAALGGYFQGLDGCGGLQARAPGSPHDCWTEVGAAYRRSQAALDAQLGRAAGQLRGGCRELVVDARGGARAQAGGLERIRRAGEAGDLAEADRRGKRLLADAARDDPTGRVQRAVILCLPRAAPPPGSAG